MYAIYPYYLNRFPIFLFTYYFLFDDFSFITLHLPNQLLFLSLHSKKKRRHLNKSIFIGAILIFVTVHLKKSKMANPTLGSIA